MIELRIMSEAEYSQFREYSVSEYAKDLMNGENLDHETALKNAGREFSEMLTDGPGTEDHVVMVIRDAQSGKGVGWIWYCYETDEDVKQVFLCDFLIFEDERRKGYASAALAEMERRSKADGCGAAALFVWDHNGPGAALYRKCGYAPEERDIGGVRMKKPL